MIGNRKIKVTICVVFFYLFNLSCADQDGFVSISDSKFLMGTIFEITALHHNTNQTRTAFKLAFDEIARIENLLSPYIEESEVAKLNKNAGLKPIVVSEETFSIINRALEYSDKLNGAFDISIGSIVSLWGFNTQREIKLPKQSQIDSLLSLVDYHYILLNKENYTIFLKFKDMEIDLGSFAKGYAVDRVSQILKQQGIDRFIINGGGDIYASSLKQNKKKWEIGVQHPRNLSAMIAKIQLTEYAVATSGDYQNYKEINGVRYHHIFDPKTGYPAMKYQSVTVLAPTTEEADFLATGIFVNGHKDIGPTIGKEIPFFVIDSNGVIYFNQSMKEIANIELLD